MLGKLSHGGWYMTVAKGVAVVLGAALVFALAFGDAEARGRGGRGGHGGHGGHGGKGGHGGHGGKGGVSVSAPAAVSAPAQSGGLTTGSLGQMNVDGKLIADMGAQGTLTAAQARTDADTKAAMADAGHFGLVTVDRINTDGSFTYSGYEWAVVAFAQQMKARGYDMGWQGEPSTDFANGQVTEAAGG